MSIPVALQSFKSAGVYRLVYDKSTILNEDTQIMRLVIGYSAQGPFNTPVLVRSISEFKALYGEPSKSLEKRGVYFHRLALQALLEGPIICLNLKRFSGETLQGATVDTSFNPDMTPIDVVELNVEDIYDTTRFWELSAFKLADITDVNGRALDGYISISSTNTKNTSCTFFLRKASGPKVAAYNVTVNDWYKDSGEEVPEYLQDKLNNKISDFFAEIYIFKGQFTPDQVLSSETLKHYFMAVKDDDGNDVLQLRPYVRNAYDEPIDTLEALYNEPTSGALTHYVGALIPYFKDKTDVYQSLDIQMNNDVDTNNLMMNFNVDLLEEGLVNIDLSGRVRVPVVPRGGVGVDLLYYGNATSTLMGNEQAPIVSDIISFAVNFKPVVNDATKKRVLGNFYVSKIDDSGLVEANGKRKTEYDENDYGVLTFHDIKFSNNGRVLIDSNGNYIDANDEQSGEPMLTVDDSTVYNFTVKVNYKYWDAALQRFGITATRIETEWDDEGRAIKWDYKYNGGVYREGADLEMMTIPESLVASVTNYKAGTEILKNGGEITYQARTSFAIAPIAIASDATQKNKKADGKTDLPVVYGSSVSFVPKGSFEIGEFDGSVALTSIDDSSLVGFFAPGDCLLAEDASTDADMDGELDVADGYYDNVYVQEIGSNVDTEGVVTYYVKLTGKPFIYSDENQDLVKVKVTENSVDPDKWVGKTFYYSKDENEAGLHMLYNTNGRFTGIYVEVGERNSDGTYNFTSFGDAAGEVEFATGKVSITASAEKAYLIRIDAPLNQEIGNMRPVYLEGYTYANPKPASTSMYDKQKWQDFILSTLTDYKGIRTGLLNKADLDYRYVIDTFETYVTAGAKNILSFLCREKQSAFAILNFPSVRTFVKCPYTSFTDAKGIFNVEYVVKGYNPKKSHTIGFSLPSDSEGASFCAFYTPLKFTDGYIDSLVPSAALVSNLFIEKYRSRQPYYIVAGPNYGAISASGMTGPDYNYSREELNVIEPYGVNCMVYRPGFGTFINANQTAKQTPKSALSSVNVRELVIYLQDEIEKLLQSYQWEFNNQTVRNKIKDKADVICARIQHNGGIQDFVNIMDESNNTPEIIDNEMAVLSTHIEPGRGMGKMVHELTLYRTGQMRAAISEA